MEPAEKFRVLCTILAVPVFLSLLLVSRYSLVAFGSRLRFFRKLNDKQSTQSNNNSAHLKQVDISKKIITEVQQALRHTYGHFWHSKIRILLVTGNAADVEYQGMMTLQQLSDRLSSLDEQKGKYITVSELKSVVFSTIQSFNHAIPAEEQLRRLSQYPAGSALPEAEKTQLELHLKQLATRYAQIKQDASAQ